MLNFVRWTYDIIDVFNKDFKNVLPNPQVIKMWFEADKGSNQTIYKFLNLAPNRTELVKLWSLFNLALTAHLQITACIEGDK